MAESKKVLVAFDPRFPQQNSSEFLVPLPTTEAGWVLLGSKSGKVRSYGMVVLTGRPVNENDLFAKLIETGQSIPDVQECLENLAAFIEEVKAARIGNIVELTTGEGAFKLIIKARTPNGFQRSDCE